MPNYPYINICLYRSLEAQQARGNKTGRGEELSRLEDPKAEPGTI